MSAHVHAPPPDTHARPAGQLAVGGGARPHLRRPRAELQPGRVSVFGFLRGPPRDGSGHAETDSEDPVRARSARLHVRTLGFASTGETTPPTHPHPGVPALAVAVGAEDRAAGCRTLPPASSISGTSCLCTPKAPSMASSAPWGELTVPGALVAVAARDSCTC